MTQAAEYVLMKAALMPERPGAVARLLQPGQRVVFTGTPTVHMRPHNDAARAEWAKAFPPHSGHVVTFGHAPVMSGHVGTGHMAHSHSSPTGSR